MPAAYHGITETWSKEIVGRYLLENYMNKETWDKSAYEDIANFAIVKCIVVLCPHERLLFFSKLRDRFTCKVLEITILSKMKCKSFRCLFTLNKKIVERQVISLSFLP